MTNFKITADDKIPFLKGVFEPYADVIYFPGKDISKEELQDADALITRTRTKCKAELLDGSKVKLITSATIGYDHIDTIYCKENNIKWTNAPGCNSSSVQQYFASAILTIAKKLNIDLKKRTLGVIGAGNVGSKVVKIGELFGMRVLLNDPPRARAEGQCGFVSLETILQECDIITFHVPLNKSGEDKTYHLADKSFFDKMNTGTIFFNTSRGEVNDTTALKAALKSGKIAASVIDVWENEPNIDTELLTMADIATPHIAGYSNDGKANGTAACVREISRFFGIKELNNWYPKEIPPPPQSIEINIDCHRKSRQQLLSEAILHTYNVMEDNMRLKDSVATFEKQRGDYPVRREFNSFTLKLANANNEIKTLFDNLGFNIILAN